MAPSPAVPGRPAKSTNGRFIAAGVRASFRMLEAVAPEVGAAWAERVFFRPPPSRLSPRVQAVLASGRTLRVPFRGDTLAAWSWGEGPRVLLAHGWGGRGGHLGPFVRPLREAGFAVVAFDAPAHGASPGRHTTLPEMAAALRAVAEATGTDAPAGVVAHSAGGVATAYAVRHGLAIGRAVFLAPAARPDTYAEGFAARLGLGHRIQARLRRRSEQRVGVPFSGLDVAAFARQLAVPLLVVHDEQDEEVPYRDGAEVAGAWPGARLVTTLGLGHHQILRDPGVLGEVASFLSGAGTLARSDSRSEEALHANG